ncbi:larval serum protein 1 alpha chain [Drosophila innubila]|uniref:larval serum protein 1 alpha chain n=1 Tax=Drosophila innubila TaxID=198719 RepID=UPI00148C9228|nr:larval serum protein 1 alpha chain [Drosophila innubila]
MRLSYLLSLISFLLQLCHNVAIFPGNIVNHYYLNKQRFLLEILHHLPEPLLHEQWLGLGQQIVTDKSQYVHYNDHMIKFYQLLSTDRLLPRDVYYNPQQPEHYQETVGLFHFFYNTREWSTLRQNICWARVFVNPGLFLNALIQTLMKRDDYRALIVPRIYELLPAPYHSEQVLREASRFNYANWIWQNQEQGNDTGVQLVLPKRLLPDNLSGGLRNTSKWSEAMSEVHILSLEERRQSKGLALLIEDPGWLSYWYYINMGIALQEEPTETDRLRDWFYFQLSQLLARYKLELYARKLEYRRLARVRKQEFTPLRTWHYQRYQLETEETLEYLSNLIEKLLIDVQEAISTQRLLLSNGTLIDLRHDQNWQLGLAELFPYDLSQLQMPSAKEAQQLLDLHTMLRDPRFYFYADRILYAYRSYRSAFQPNYRQLVRPTDLRILEVQVSPLITYEEPVDIDVSNLLHSRHFFFGNQFMWPQAMQVRKRRLQQRPFRINLQLESNKTQSIILRTYLTTSGGNMNEEPFYQLDSFLTVLHAGNNFINRESIDFSGMIGDHISITELYHYVRLAERDQFDFPLNITIPSCGFPRRLILPRGGATKGLSMRLFVLATPYNYRARQENELNCDFSNGVSSWDELPFGYPFERFVGDEEELHDAHTMWKAVEIQHEDRNTLIDN